MSKHLSGVLGFSLAATALLAVGSLSACVKDNRTPQDSGSNTIGDGNDSTGSDNTTGDDESSSSEDPSSSEDNNTWTDPNQEIEFSYLWAANADEGSVSKIDTRAHKEVARYRTGPSDYNNPSRTSVNLDGDVAVVNRAGNDGTGQSSVTKIFATVESCVDKNKNGKIDTSTGPTDLKPWGEDECVGWNVPLPRGARPAAWTSGQEIPGDADSGTEFSDPELWVSGPSEDGSGSVEVFLLDGKTGAINKQVRVPNYATPEYGIYGGAVDKNGDLWAVPVAVGVPSDGAKLLHVPYEDPTKFETFPIPDNQGYGMTVDRNGRIWVGCDSDGRTGGILQRFDPEKKEWKRVDLSNFTGSQRWWIRGMTEDGEGELWAAVVLDSAERSGGGILRVDSEKVEAIEFIGKEKLQGVTQPAGVSVDVDGQVWMVDQYANGTGGAYSYNPMSGEVIFVGPLAGPYTYSDMTGFALRNVVIDPPV